MNPRRFDEIARLTATRWPRRTLLKAVAGSVAAGGLSLWHGARAFVAPPSGSRAANVPPRQPEPEHSVFSSDSVPVCTPEQDETWSFARDFTQGVIGRDPLGHWIGPYPAYKSGGAVGDFVGFFAGRNWYPLAPEKKTLCGELHHFNFYDAWSSGDEADWNNFIIPAEQFAYLIDDARPYADNIHDCDGASCMEAEVTPDEHHYRFYYFDKETGSSPLEGQGLCTYGPWVREEIHGNWPEIHPSELFWWREQVDVGPFNLLVIQDDSNRFDRRDNYDLFWPPPPLESVPADETDWRPWSAYPRLAEFRVAFQADPGTLETSVFGLTQAERREVITGDDPDARKDSDDGRQHTLRYNSRSLLTVVERQEVDGDVGVQFVDLCRDATDTRLRGYIQLTTKVGAGDRGGEGFTLLRLVKEGSEPVDVLDLIHGFTSAQAGATVLVGALPESLRREDIDGRPQLLGDLKVQLEPGASFAAEDATVDRAVLRTTEEAAGAEVELVFVPDAPPEAATASPVADEGAASPRPSPATGTVVGLPVSVNAPVAFTMQSGVVLTATSPGLFLAPRIALETPLSTAVDDAAWPSMAAAVDASPLLTTPPAPLHRVGTWGVEVAPLYGPWRAGGVAFADETPFTEALNELLLNDERSRLRELFGAEAPFSVMWSYQATNVADGAPVDITTGPDVAETEIRVELQPAQVGSAGVTVADARLEVTFPTQPAGAVFELVATARFTDVLGGTGEVQHSVWSHALMGGEDDLVENTLGVVAALAGVQANAVVEGSRIDSAPSSGGAVPFDDRDLDPLARRLRGVRMFATRAAADGVVTAGELRALVRGVRLAEGVA